jgi:hypothetical protein
MNSLGLAAGAAPFRRDGKKIARHFSAVSKLERRCFFAQATEKNIEYRTRNSEFRSIDKWKMFDLRSFMARRSSDTQYFDIRHSLFDIRYSLFILVEFLLAARV